MTTALSANTMGRAPAPAAASSRVVPKLMALTHRVQDMFVSLTREMIADAARRRVVQKLTKRRTT
jgi:hypothetical protein